MSALQPATFDAVVLAGGRGSRLGGVDKASLEIDGQRLLDRVVRAARAVGTGRVIVVGPDRDPSPSAASDAAGNEGQTLAQPDVVLREDPPFGGPLPALAAGLGEVEAEWLLLLPCDLEHPEKLCEQLLAAWRAPYVDSAGDRDGDSECAAATDVRRDGVRLVDEDGRPQWLAGVYRAAALRRGIATAPDGKLENLPLRVAFVGAQIAEEPAASAVIADIDTPEDLSRARRQGS